jgi:hypothetical protein
MAVMPTKGKGLARPRRAASSQHASLIQSSPFIIASVPPKRKATGSSTLTSPASAVV